MLLAYLPYRRYENIWTNQPAGQNSFGPRRTSMYGCHVSDHVFSAIVVTPGRLVAGALPVSTLRPRMVQRVDPLEPRSLALLYR